MNRAKTPLRRRAAPIRFAAVKSFVLPVLDDGEVRFTIADACTKLPFPFAQHQHIRGALEAEKPLAIYRNSVGAGGRIRDPTPGDQVDLGSQRQDPEPHIVRRLVRRECAARSVLEPIAIAATPMTDRRRDLAALGRIAESDDADAQFSLGTWHFVGQDGPPDYAAAVKWFRRTAEQGNVNEQAALAAAYLGGQGVPLDATAAAKWYPGCRGPWISVGTYQNVTRSDST